MKKIDAIITPLELDDIKDALCNLGIHGMTITEIKVSGETFKMPGHSVDFMPRVKIEIIVTENIVQKTIEIIKKHIKTSRAENANIYVINIEDVVRIRTGQKGGGAII